MLLLMPQKFNIPTLKIRCLLATWVRLPIDSAPFCQHDPPPARTCPVRRVWPLTLFASSSDGGGGGGGDGGDGGGGGAFFR